MARKSSHSQAPLLPVEKESSAGLPAASGQRKRKAALQLKRRSRSARNTNGHANVVVLPRVMRIRRLIMAALRVWELKHGIHDAGWNNVDEPLWLDFEQQECFQPVVDE